LSVVRKTDGRGEIRVIELRARGPQPEWTGSNHPQASYDSDEWSFQGGSSRMFRHDERFRTGEPVFGASSHAQTPIYKAGQIGDGRALKVLDISRLALPEPLQ
jgi:hypothetical protein